MEEGIRGRGEMEGEMGRKYDYTISSKRRTYREGREREGEREGEREREGGIGWEGGREGRWREGEGGRE